MRDPKRIETVIKILTKAWKRYPDLRLGQLLGNTCAHIEELYYLEDDELIQLIQQLYLSDQKEAQGENKGY